MTPIIIRPPVAANLLYMLNRNRPVRIDKLPSPHHLRSMVNSGYITITPTRQYHNDYTGWAYYELTEGGCQIAHALNDADGTVTTTRHQSNKHISITQSGTDIAPDWDTLLSDFEN